MEADPLRHPPVPPSPLPGRQVLLDERKHPDAPHWRWWSVVLGEDDRGTWLGTAPGTVHRRGTEPTRVFRHPMLVLVPHADPWILECTPGHPTLSLYVDVGTVPTWHDDGRRVRQVDLDLDVAVTHAGDVEVLDREEFAQRRTALAYPPSLVELAESATARAVRLLEDDPAHFGQKPWLARLAEVLEG